MSVRVDDIFDAQVEEERVIFAICLMDAVVRRDVRYLKADSVEDVIAFALDHEPG